MSTLHITKAGEPALASSFWPKDVKYGLQFRMAKNDTVYRVSLVVGEEAFIRDRTTCRASRSFTRAYVAHQVRLGNFIICE